MPDNRKFHDFALQSILFKGRSDWYFCYLKAEKIAHVLTVLGASEGEAGEEICEIARRSASLSGEIAHLAAGEMELSPVLADTFALLGAVRMLSVRGYLAPETAAILLREFETVAERLVRGSNPSPFVTVEDFSVPQLSEAPAPLPRATLLGAPGSAIKDNRTKGQSQGQSNRMSLILELVRKKKSVSIKEIAAEIKGCSEKTIQRELNILIERGLIRREGERRWSVYIPA